MRGIFFEMLDLDNQEAGWTSLQVPRLQCMSYFEALAIGNRYIYVVACNAGSGTRAFCSYDTVTGEWKQQSKPTKKKRGRFVMTSIFIPGEGTYIVVVTGCVFVDATHLLEPAAIEAYHLESNRWIQLPYFPVWHERLPCGVTSIGNRYIVVVGGTGGGDKKNSVIALDWKTKDWFELPALPETAAFDKSTGELMILPGCVNRVITTGKWLVSGCSRTATTLPASLDIAPGIGWAIEKQLLLCFRGKAQMKKSKKKPCLLEDLPSGVFANILLYLFVPFPDEVECPGSIFALSSPPSSHLTSKKRNNSKGLEDPTTDDAEKKKKARNDP